MNEHRLIIGVTGGIGSGKTTVTDYFNSFGVNVIDSDVVAREVVQPGEPCLDKIQARYGNSILEGQRLNRVALRKIIFNDPTEKDWLETLMHPIIRSRSLAQLRESSGEYAILSSPLLFETGQDNLVHRVLVVDANHQKQLNRTSSRDNISEEDIEKIIHTQLARQQRLALADDILDNNGDLTQTKLQVQKFHDLYTDLAKTFQNEY